MQQYSLSLSDQDDKLVRQGIVAPLRAYNQSQTAPSEHRPLVIAIRDKEDQVIGGLWGYTHFGWLFTELLVVPEALRGQGIATTLLKQAEQEAILRGCHGAWLDTFEFQARGFYEQLGYSCFGELADYPKGFARFFMQKQLTNPSQST
ncbi:MAG: GNAT family N-acetyltransferase [Proteobacteria bacterium]|nr:GNAT family N-acetyltransferase [Pseudomonadota bacterium]